MVREVHVQPIQVMAVSEQDAIKRVREGEGELIPDSLEYSHALDPEYWTVER